MQHGFQSLRQIGRRRHLIRDAGVANLRLGAHDALGQCRRSSQEGARDLLGGETADLAQGQRDARLRRQGGVAAGEDQAQPVVRDALFVPLFLVLGVVVDLGSERRQRGVEPGAPANAVDGLEPAGRHQPGPGVGRYAILCPLFQRGGECIVQRVLGEVEVAEQANEGGEDTARLGLVDLVHQPAHLLSRVDHPCRILDLARAASLLRSCGKSLRGARLRPGRLNLPVSSAPREISSASRSRREMRAMSSTAASKATSLARDGLLKPLIFLTNCSDAARISSSVAGGSKLNNVLIFLHMRVAPYLIDNRALARWFLGSGHQFQQLAKRDRPK